MEHQETIQIALERLKETINIESEYIPSKIDSQDGNIVFVSGNIKERFPIEIKYNIRESHLPFLKAIKIKWENPLIITNYVSDNVKQQLRKEGIFYLDTSGNAYIQSNQLMIYIQGQKEKEVARPKVNKVFNATGLKVLFALLNDLEMHTYNYRYIANHTDVALGSVSAIMQDLKELGFLIDIDEQNRKLINYKELLNRWVMEYGENLRPKLFTQKYRFLDSSSKWQNLRLNTHKTYWGGEPAADLLTDYLKPEKFILYSNESKAELMKNYRLIPDSGGNITVYNLFWNTANYPKWQVKKIVPPILVYTDLMLLNDSRTIETAQKVYEQYLSHLD